MIDTLVHLIENILIPLGFWGVFLASVTEEVIAPIPSAFVMLLAGFTFLHGPVGFSFLYDLFVYVILPVSIGGVLGSLFIYYLSFYIGRPFVEKWGKWFGLSLLDVDRVSVSYQSKQKEGWALFVLRAIPVIPSVAISSFAGLIGMPLRSYITYSMLGVAVRAIVLGLIGWQVGDVYATYANVISRYESYILYGIIAALIVVGIYFVFTKKRKH